VSRSACSPDQRFDGDVKIPRRKDDLPTDGDLRLVA